MASTNFREIVTQFDEDPLAHCQIQRQRLATILKNQPEQSQPGGATITLSSVAEKSSAVILYTEARLGELWANGLDRTEIAEEVCKEILNRGPWDDNEYLDSVELYLSNLKSPEVDDNHANKPLSNNPAQTQVIPTDSGKQSSDSSIAPRKNKTSDALGEALAIGDSTLQNEPVLIHGVPGQPIGPRGPAGIDCRIRAFNWTNQLWTLAFMLFKGVCRGIWAIAMLGWGVATRIVLHPGYLVYLLILLGLIYQLEPVPIIGMLVSFIRKKTISYLWGFLTRSLVNKFTVASETGVSTELPLIPSINDTARLVRQLSQVGITILPLSHVMKAASIHLIGAGDIARASRLTYRQEISIAIDNLEQETTSSATILRQFDNGMMSLISDMDVHLNISLREMQRIVIETEADLSYSEILGGSTLTALSGCSAAYHLSSSMVAFSAWCSVSVFVATQVDCLLYRYTESNQYANFTCVPSRLLRSYDGSRSREHILTTRAAALATEFYTFLQIQIAHVSELRRLANKGLLKLDDVKSGFSDVNTLVYRQHEITKGRKKKLEDRKTETRSYWDELFGREVGITPKLREDLIDLIIEIETLQELTFTCLDAEQAFHHALEILQDLDNLLLRMGKRMAQTQGIYKEQRSVDINRWPDLVELTRSLLPIVDAFQKTGKYYKDSRLHAANDWKAKLDQCVRTGGRDCGHGYQATSLPASQTAM